MSQSKVSKIENGRVAASAVDVTAWARATGAADHAEDLMQRAEVAQTEAVAWRKVLNEGAQAKQRQVAALEQGATAIRVFEPLIVPCLLQTADYARRLYLAHQVEGRPDVGAAVAMRLERQVILYDASRQFEFVMTETALRRRMEPCSTMLAQLDRIRSVSTLPNVAMAIIPSDSEEMLPGHGFTLFEGVEGDDTQVLVETLTAGLSISHPADLATYQGALESLRRAAAHGADAVAILGRLLRELLEQQAAIPT